MIYITTNEICTVIEGIQDTTGVETITYEVTKVSDGSVFASGNAAHLSDILWKVSFTPTTENEI